MNNTASERDITQWHKTIDELKINVPNIRAPNKRASNLWSKSGKQKVEIDTPTDITGEFNTFVLITYVTGRNLWGYGILEQLPKQHN